MMIAGGSFAYFSEVAHTTLRGAYLSLSLPDGSTVMLNVDSELKYKPLLWFASKTVELNGEAYFEVKSGGRFTVKSGKNKVMVLGTSFNVFARNEKYSVTCMTGKVMVTADNRQTTLTPNMQVTLRNGNFNVAEIADTEQHIGWRQNRFVFNGAPLTEVIKEIERQYDIQISNVLDFDYSYTGNFSKTENPEDVLEIVGKPFGITFLIKNKEKSRKQKIREAHP